jgi:adenylate kinase
VNADNLKPRIPDEILYKLYKLRLSYNDCQNRGYILEGFPRSFKDAQQVFMISQQQEGEEEEQEKAKILNLTTVPHTVFCFKATDQQLLEKVPFLSQGQRFPRGKNRKFPLQ